MKIEVTIKDGHEIHEPTTKRTWIFGYIRGFVTMRNGIGYAVVQTQYGEFETVHMSALQATQIQGDI